MSTFDLRGDATYKDGNITLITWLLTDGEIDTTVNTGTATIYDSGGELVHAFSDAAAADAQGVFKFSDTLTTQLTQFTQYYVTISIKDAAVAGTVRSSILPLKRFS